MQFRPGQHIPVPPSHSTSRKGASSVRVRGVAIGYSVQSEGHVDNALNLAGFTAEYLSGEWCDRLAPSQDKRREANAIQSKWNYAEIRALDFDYTLHDNLYCVKHT